jgi:hypothetical protein
MENVGVLVHGKFWQGVRGKHWRSSVRGKLWHHTEYYYVRMHVLNLALHGEHTHSNVHMGCACIA